MLELEHAPGAVRPDVGIAVAVAADPAPEGERPRVRRQLQLEPAQLVGEHLEHVRHSIGVQAVEVPDRVARLVHHVRLRDAQLVGLPEQVHGLLEPRGGARVRSLQQLGYLPQLVEHGPPRGLRRVGGEHGPHREALHLGGDLRVGDAGGGDAVDGLREPAAVARPDARQLPAAVHLLRHVREVEVGGERPHELGRLDRLDVGEQRRGAVPVRADQPADLLNLVEQLLALLAHEGAPEQDAQLADVAAQAGLGLSRWRSDS